MKFQSDRLRGRIVEKGLSQTKVAVMLDITAKTFYVKIKTGSFYAYELVRMAEILEIANPWEFYFKE